MKRDNDYYIIEAMELYGGSFVKSLAQCFKNADPINYIKLQVAFINYWEEYSKMVKEES